MNRNLKPDTLYFLECFSQLAEKQKEEIRINQLYKFVKIIESKEFLELKKIYNEEERKEKIEPPKDIDAVKKALRLSRKFLSFSSAPKEEALMTGIKELIKDFGENLYQKIYSSFERRMLICLYLYLKYKKKGIEACAELILEIISQPLEFGIKNNLPCIMIKEKISPTKIHKWLIANKLVLERVCRGFGSDDFRSRERAIRDLGFYIENQKGDSSLTIANKHKKITGEKTSQESVDKAIRKIESELN